MKVCRCLDGGDSCDNAGSCAVRKVVQPVAVPLTPCQECQQCITAVQPFVATAVASASDTADSLAGRFEALCLSNYTSKDVVNCKNAKNAVSYSYRGNAARRAGVLCTKLGKCSANLNCMSLNTTNSTGQTLVGTLSMCTAEGITGGSGAIGEGGSEHNPALDSAPALHSMHSSCWLLLRP